MIVRISKYKPRKLAFEAQNVDDDNFLYGLHQNLMRGESLINSIRKSENYKIYYSKIRENFIKILSYP